MKKSVFVSSLSIGLILMGLSIFAEQIGIDNDSGWGMGRIVMLKAGIIFLVISFIGIFFRDKLENLEQHISKIINRFNKINYSKRMIIFSLPTIVIVIAGYIWFALPNFETSSFNYYSLQTIAFKKHQLFLVEGPSPALMALDDPYDDGLRKRNGVEDFPWDVSLYDNKFYFYWGPVPSLISTPFSIETLNLIGDEYLVLVFILGLFFYLTIFCYSIWIRFNQTLPSWLFSISILAIGLSAPSTWMLNSSRVYEGAIIGCQLFFIGGCYWAYSSLSENEKLPSQTKLVLAGLHWALALGTRITILPAVLFTTAMTLLYVSQRIKPLSHKSYIPFLFCLCSPLAMAAIGLGWYNWARFDSIFEFGLKYQLATVNYTAFHDLFSPRHVYENLYNYFFHPVKLQNQFPYIRPIENIFSNERLAGLLYTSPYILYAGLFVKGVFYQKKQPDDTLRNWLILTLAGSSLISALTILLYYFPATRFGEDFMPSLMLIATLSLGLGYRFWDKKKTTRHAYIVSVIAIAMFTVIASSLVAFPQSKAKHVIDFINETYKLLGLR